MRAPNLCATYVIGRACDAFGRALDVHRGVVYDRRARRGARRASRRRHESDDVCGRTTTPDAREDVVPCVRVIQRRRRRRRYYRVLIRVVIRVVCVVNPLWVWVYRVYRVVQPRVWTPDMVYIEVWGGVYVECPATPWHALATAGMDLNATFSDGRSIDRSLWATWVE